MRHNLLLLLFFLFTALCATAQNNGCTITGVVREYDLNMHKEALDGVQVQISVGGNRSDITKDGGKFAIKNVSYCTPGAKIQTDKNSFLKNGYELFYPDALNFWYVPNASISEPTEILMCKSSRINEVRRELFNIIDEYYKNQYEQVKKDLEQANMDKRELDFRLTSLEAQLRDTSRLMEMVNQWLYMDHVKCDSVSNLAYSFFEKGEIQKASDIMNKYLIDSAIYINDIKRMSEAMVEVKQVLQFVKRRLTMNIARKNKDIIPFIEQDCKLLINICTYLLTDENLQYFLDKELLTNQLAEAYACQGDISMILDSITDPKEFISNYHKAAELGNAHAQYKMGEIYENFLLTKSKDYVTDMFNMDSARYWYSKSAAQKDTDAILRMEYFYDFEIQDKNGNIIYYHILPDNKSVSIVFKTFSMWGKNIIQPNKNIIIPPKVKYNNIQYAVRKIEKHAFLDCDNLRSMTIPNSVTSIGEGAFAECDNLRSVTIPNSVTSIGKWAFEGCVNLRSVTIPNSVTSIGEWAFSACHNLRSVTIGNSVKAIGEWTFFGCDSLRRVTIGNSVTSIGEEAFNRCVNLRRVTIGNSVKTIGKWAFEGCVNLRRVTIPNSVTSIGEWAFAGCDNLQSVTIPNSVKTIGNCAFALCKNLKDVNIPNSVTTLGNSVFLGCDSLRNVIIPDSVTTIGEYAFFGCKNLKNVIIPDSVTTIGKSAFNDCGNLQSVTIPNSVKTIDEYTFAWCDNLQSVTIPNSVKTIGNFAFAGCENLQSVTIPNSVTTIGEYAFFGCKNLKNVIIPDSVTTIGESAFSLCKYLRSVTIGNSVKTIGRSAFYECENLRSVTIGNSVKTIGEHAFWGCRNLQSMTIPNSVISIDPNAFDHYLSLEFENDCIYSVDSTGRFLLKKQDKNYELIAYLNNGSICNVTIPNSVTTIGERAFKMCKNLQSVTIPNSVTTIGDYAFSECYHLKSVTIPNSVTTIGDYAFSECYRLKSVTIPNSVTSIGGGAFSLCKYLRSVTISNSVTTIGNYAFSECYRLKSVTIPNSVTTIGKGAFRGCPFSHSK